MEWRRDKRPEGKIGTHCVQKVQQKRYSRAVNNCRPDGQDWYAMRAETVSEALQQSHEQLATLAAVVRRHASTLATRARDARP